MKRPFTVLLLLVLSIPLVADAKPKSRTFNVAKDRLFAVALKVISEHHRVEYADEKLGVVSFHTGMSMGSNGFDCSILIQEAAGGKSTITVNVQKTRGQVVAWGSGDRMASKLFGWIGDDLEKDSSR